tara:strand:- start:3036 stop:3782 length:747 start_codon:yes stop_codon:yes gene_type:complete
MINKIIEFSAPKEYLNIKNTKPISSVLNIPEWYKKIPHTIDQKTVKGCMPFLDTLKAGYILKMPIDFRLQHNVKRNDTRTTRGDSEVEGWNNSFVKSLNVNKKNTLEVHPISQLGNSSPIIQKNKTLPFHKILNPWIIKTPPGYSCLFVPPLNNTDDRFSIIPGIVDTDKFKLQVNFPFVVNGDKYPVLDTTIKIGTPYVQVIPFKREGWEMKFKEEKKEEKEVNRFLQQVKNINVYKSFWWVKKLWK